MQTLILQSNPRKGTDGKLSISIEAIGESAIQDTVKEAIRGLEHHPSRVARRTIIDMMALIEQFNFQIVYTEHGSEDGVETWLFILQGGDQPSAAGPRKLAQSR